MKQVTIIVFVLCFLIAGSLFAQEKGMMIVGKASLDMPNAVYRTGWAVVIGINNYPPNVPQLNYAVNDAISVAMLLKSKFGFADNNVRILIDDQATKQGIMDALSKLTDPDLVNDEDCVLVYFSGHGQTVPLPKNTGGGDMGFLIPYDAKIDLTKLNMSQYDNYCIGMDELNKKGLQIPAKHVIFIVDACYSGLVITGDRGLDPKTANFIEKVSFVPARQIITAGGKGDKATEDPALRHGLFTYKLLQGLEKGIADDNDDGVITGSELGNHLRGVVPRENPNQTPQYRVKGEGEFMFLPKTETIPTVVVSTSTTIGKDGAEMVLIPAGEFQMGSSDGASDEKPIHTVYLDAFYIDKYEVTNAQYKKFVQATGHKEPEGYRYINGNWQSGFKPWSDSNFNGDNQPVVCVSWEDAKAYADWAGERLPTEAEWEKAARGGVTGKKYVWGDEWPPTKNAGNFDDETTVDSSRIDGYSDGYVYTAPVGSFKPNGYGLYDMAGNVWEWCADWYDSNYYANSPKSNPTGPSSGQYRVLRGGSWYDLDVILRTPRRSSYAPTLSRSGIGFRCVSGLSVTP